MCRWLNIVAVFFLFGCNVHLDIGSNFNLVPVFLPLPSRYLTSGGDAACAVHNGEVQCWGRDDYGQLAIDVAHDLCGATPCQQIPGHPTIVNPKMLAVGGFHSCFIDNDQHLQCMGANMFGQLGRAIADPDMHAQPGPTTLRAVQRVALGRYHACAIVGGGDVYCWGLGESGQLGRAASNLERCSVPAGFAPSEFSTSDVACSTTPLKVSNLKNILQLSLGAYSSCALDTAGRVYCWGDNSYGQLGLGTTQGTAAPNLVSVPPADFVVSGAFFSCVISQDGFARCFGKNDVGQLGVGNTTTSACTGGVPCLPGPTVLADLHDAKKIVAGTDHACAVLADHTVRCWGSDVLEQLGNSGNANESCDVDGTMIACHRSPTEPYNLQDVVDLAASDSNTCSLRTDGEIRCWGNNVFGQCGGFASSNMQLSFPTTVYLQWQNP